MGALCHGLDTAPAIVADGYTATNLRGQSMSTKRTGAAKALRTRTTSKPSSYAGSIADRLERSPGGIAGALARLNDAKASGRPMTALEKFAIATGEKQPTPAANAPSIPVSLFEDDLHERLMNAAAIIVSVRKALDGDQENPEESDALQVAVAMLHKIDDELDTACWQATEAFDLAHPDHPEAIERRRILEGMRTAGGFRDRDGKAIARRSRSQRARCRVRRLKPMVDIDDARMTDVAG